MHKRIMIAVTVLGLTTAGVLAAPAHPCRPDLERLVAQFSAIGFEGVVQPRQAHVRGGSGHDHTGGVIGYMEAQIRQAQVDCAAGLEADVRARIAAVRSELARGRG